MSAIKTRPSIVYAHDFFMTLPGLMASFLTRSKFIYDAHELIILNGTITYSKRDRFFYLAEKIAVKRADLVIAANTERAGIMQSHYNLNKTPLVIQNISQEQGKHSAMKGILQEYPMLPHKRLKVVRLIYQGDMSIERGIDSFISAMNILDDQYELILAGSGPELGLLKKLVERKLLDKRVLFLGRVPREHLFEIMKTCDIGIITYPDKGLNNIYCAPNKIFEYAQAGLTILATCQPPLKHLIDNYNIGIVIGCEVTTKKDMLNEIVKAILQIVDKYESYKRNIPVFLKENNWSKEGQKLQNEVLRLIK